MRRCTPTCARLCLDAEELEVTHIDNLSVFNVKRFKPSGPLIITITSEPTN